ncbi:MAG: hypothetical protein ACYDHT_06660 [Solirubrobacteraceae bacterium]
MLPIGLPRLGLCPRTGRAAQPMMRLRSGWWRAKRFQNTIPWGGTMQRISIIAKALLCGALVYGLAVGSADAKTPTLHLTAGGHSLVAGDFYELEGSQTSYESTAGNLTCSSVIYSGLIGADLTNNAKTDKVEVKESRGNFNGGPCEGSLPLGANIRQYWLGGLPLGQLTLSTTGKAQFKASGEAQIKLFGVAANAYCYYGFKTLKGTVAFEESGPAFVDFFQQKMKLKEHDVACPKTMLLTTAFTSWYDPTPSTNQGHASVPVEGAIF